MIEDIHNKLQDVRNPLAAMAVLIREMDLETDSEPGEGSLTIGKTYIILYHAIPTTLYHG